MYKISKYLKERINEAGGAKRFAEKYDFKADVIQQYINDERMADEVTLRAIAAKLGVDDWKILAEIPKDEEKPNK
ncbi:MAG: hypothetical protein FWG70_09075 [Oscillospiraceae bacterium]|nr:hypothetical protein [Oscillospiraceae bacterium]